MYRLPGQTQGGARASLFWLPGNFDGRLVVCLVATGITVLVAEFGVRNL